MSIEHVNYNYSKVFQRLHDTLIKIDVTDLKCKICSSAIPGVESLMRHLSQEHKKHVKFDARFGVLPFKQNGDNQWLCVYCERIDAEFFSFKRHLETHCMNFACDKCGTSYLSDRALRDHHQQMKCSKTAYHPRNGKIMRSRGNAEIILQCSTVCPFRTWKNNFNCVFCRIQTSDPNSLRNHVAERHANYDVQTAFYKRLGKDFLSVDVTDIQCKLCFTPLSNIDALTYHLKQHHEQPINLDAPLGLLPFRLDDGSAWKCTICSNKFKDFISLKKHTAGHFQNYVCDVCGEGFITESAMVAHTKIPHDNKYNCSRCLATFSTEEEKNIHHKTQHTLPPYMCIYCEDKPRFTNWELRKKHLMEVHNYKTGADKYECLVCQKSFKSISAKHTHMKRTHKKSKDLEQKYPCASCPRAYTTKLFLERHMTKKHFVP